MAEPHPSSSAVQRKAEPVVLAALAAQLGVAFGDPSATLGGLELDAFAEGDPPVLVEAFAHVGRCKAGQRRKILQDMAKLLLAERRLGRPCRKVVAVVDAVAHIQRGWDGEFARAFGIETTVVAAPPDLRLALADAQRRQRR